MLNSNWKNWALTLAILVGVTFEMLKHLPGGETTTALWKSAENFRVASLDNIIPYSVRNMMKNHAPRKLPAFPPSPVHVAGNTPPVDMSTMMKKFVADNTGTQTDFDKKKKKKKKDGDDDEWEEVIDPETGEKVRRKKKKDETQDEKKDEKPTETAELPNLQQVPQANPDDIPAAVAAAAAAAANGTGGLPTGGGGAGSSGTDGFKSLAEWEALLLKQPSLSETQTFINAYRSNMVTADIFYKIVHSMLNDSNTNMKNLGVLAAGDTPSVTSFEILADFEKTQPSGTLGTSATQFLSRYGKNLADLSILQGVLKSTDTYSAAVAAQEVDSAAKLFLTPTGGTTGSPSTQATVAANAAHFKPFETILQGLTSSSDANLSTQARQTLSDLQSLLGTSGAVAGSPESATNAAAEVESATQVP